MVVVASTGTDCWWDLRSLKGYVFHCHQGRFVNWIYNYQLWSSLKSAFNLLRFLVSQLRSSNDFVTPSTHSGRLATVFPVTTPPAESQISKWIQPRHPPSSSVILFDRLFDASQKCIPFISLKKPNFWRAMGPVTVRSGRWPSITTGKIPRNCSHLEGTYKSAISAPGTWTRL